MISRKNFITGLALASAAPPIKIYSKTLTKMPICIFSKHLQWCDYKQMADVAKEIGIDGLDITVRRKGHVLPENVTEDLPKAVEEARKEDIEVPMITTNIIGAKDEITEPILKTASKLGIKYYRMGKLKYNTKKGIVETLESYRPRIAELAGLNKKYRIHGAYQNHAGSKIGGPVWDIWMLMKGLDSHWIECQYDIRHATVEGAQSWPINLRLLSPYIKTLVVKDFKWGLVKGKWKIINTPLGEGMVDFKSYFKLVKQLGISGPISIHYEYKLHPDEHKMSFAEKRKAFVPIMRKDVETLRSMLRKAGL